MADTCIALRKKWSMYTSPLANEMCIVAVRFVLTGVFKFLHHSPKNRGHILTTKIVYFVKLSKYETDFTIVFLSSRWSKKHIWNV
jgi:hypothetical protein